MTCKIALVTTILTFSISNLLSDDLFDIHFATVDKQREYINSIGLSDHGKFLPSWGFDQSTHILKQPDNVIPAINTWEDLKKLLITTPVLKNEGISQSAFEKLSLDHMRGLSSLLSINNDLLRQLNLPNYFDNSIKQTYTIGGNKLFQDDKDHKDKLYQEIDEELEKLLYGNRELISAIKDMILSRFNVRKGVITGYDNLKKFLPQDTKEHQDFSKMQQTFFKRMTDDKIPLYSEIASSKMNEYMLLACIVPCLQQMFTKLKDFSIKKVNERLDKLNPFLELNLSSNKTVVERIYASAMRDIKHFEEINELYTQNNFNIDSYKKVFDKLSTTSSLKDLKDECNTFFEKMIDEYTNNTISKKVKEVKSEIKEIEKQLKSIDSENNDKDKKQKDNLIESKKALEEQLKSDEYTVYRWGLKIKEGYFLKLKNKAQELEDDKLFKLLNTFEFQANRGLSRNQILEEINKCNSQIKKLSYSSIIAESITNFIKYKEELEGKKLVYNNLKQGSPEYTNLCIDIDKSLEQLTKVNTSELITKINQYQIINSSLKNIDEIIKNIALCLKDELNINDYIEDSQKAIKYNDFNTWFDQTRYTKETVSVDYNKLQQDITTTLDKYEDNEINLRQTVNELIDIVNTSGFVDSIDNADVFIEQPRSNYITKLLKDFYYYANLECDNIVINRIKTLRMECPRQEKEDKSQSEEHQETVEETSNNDSIVNKLNTILSTNKTSNVQTKVRFKIRKSNNTQHAQNQSDMQQEKAVEVKIKQIKGGGQYLHILHQMKGIPDTEFKEKLQQLLLNLRASDDRKKVEDIQKSISKINKSLLLPKEIRNICETINNAAGEKDKIERFFNVFNSVKGEARDIRNDLNDLIKICYHLSTELKDSFCGAVYTKLINYYQNENEDIVNDAIQVVKNQDSKELYDIFKDKISKKIQQLDILKQRLIDDDIEEISKDFKQALENGVKYKDKCKKIIDNYFNELIYLDDDIVEYLYKNCLFKTENLLELSLHTKIEKPIEMLYVGMLNLTTTTEVYDYFVKNVPLFKKSAIDIVKVKYEELRQRYASVKQDEVEGLVLYSILIRNGSVCNLTQRINNILNGIRSKNATVIKGKKITELKDNVLLCSDNELEQYVRNYVVTLDKVECTNEVKDLIKPYEEKAITLYKKIILTHIQEQSDIFNTLLNNYKIGIKRSELINVYDNQITIKINQLLAIDFTKLDTKHENLITKIIGINKVCNALKNAIFTQLPQILFNFDSELFKSKTKTKKNEKGISVIIPLSDDEEKVLRNILCADRISKSNLHEYKETPIRISSDYKKLEEELNKLHVLQSLTEQTVSNGSAEHVFYEKISTNRTINVQIDPLYEYQCGHFWKQIIKHFSKTLSGTDTLTKSFNNSFTQKYMQCFPNVKLPDLDGLLPRIEDSDLKKYKEDTESGRDFRKMIDRISFIRDAINESIGDMRKVFVSTKDKIQIKSPVNINSLIFNKPSSDYIERSKISIIDIENSNVDTGNANIGTSTATDPSKLATHQDVREPLPPESNSQAGPAIPPPPPPPAGNIPPPPAPAGNQSIPQSVPGKVINNSSQEMPKDIIEFCNQINKVIKDNMRHVQKDQIDKYSGLYYLSSNGKIMSRVCLLGKDIYMLCRKYADNLMEPLEEKKSDAWYVEWLQNEIKKRVDPRFHSLPVFKFKL